MYSPARKAVSAMTSSVRLPSVALSKPPTASPVLAATDSVAWLSRPASGTIASTDNTNRSVCASGLSFANAKTTGTNASSQSIGLCRISLSRAFMRSRRFLSKAPRWRMFHGMKWVRVLHQEFCF
jgi:hypothetical protein